MVFRIFFLYEGICFHLESGCCFAVGVRFPFCSWSQVFVLQWEGGVYEKSLRDFCCRRYLFCALCSIQI
ncbi:hypothetical protein LJC08_01530 [Methanimicrococcus sp. OttesenSCG-928-J09]|nr:hypothetical protein [Methanimicrococcus sp. OttesenSCG-928-J09]